MEMINNKLKVSLKDLLKTRQLVWVNHKGKDLEGLIVIVDRGKIGIRYISKDTYGNPTSIKRINIKDIEQVSLIKTPFSIKIAMSNGLDFGVNSGINDITYEEFNTSAEIKESLKLYSASLKGLGIGHSYNSEFLIDIEVHNDLKQRTKRLKRTT